MHSLVRAATKEIQMGFRNSATLLGTSLLLAACGATPAGASAQPGATADSPMPCPGRSFPEFLKRFAGDEKTRLAFTAEQVAVVDYKDPDSIEQSETVITNVPKSDYNDFTLKYADGAYHNIDAANAVDPSPVNIQIEKRGTDYLVRYSYGMSEGNSWLFKPSGACWVLVEDPEPPTP